MVYWVAIAQGRCLVGVDSSDSDFNASEKTGGEKKHTLTVAEMPSHNHGITTWHNANDIVWGNGVRDNFAFSNVATEGDGTSQSTDNWYGINYRGGNSAHNNLQPYFCVYIFKRTA